jgi:hypothetical protein
MMQLQSGPLPDIDCSGEGFSVSPSLLPCIRHRYSFAGTEITSDFMLPELCAIEHMGEVQPNIAILSFKSDLASALNWAHEPRSFSLDFPGFAEFRVSTAENFSHVLCSDVSVGANATMRHLLLDVVLPRVMAIHSEFMFHAGVVRRGDDAVLIAGPSGAGKSTLCAALDASGDELLSDDGARLVPVEPLAGQYGRPRSGWAREASHGRVFEEISDYTFALAVGYAGSRAGSFRPGRQTGFVSDDRADGPSCSVHLSGDEQLSI